MKFLYILAENVIYNCEDYDMREGDFRTKFTFENLSDEADQLIETLSNQI
jgi:hypothetical protein